MKKYTILCFWVLFVTFTYSQSKSTIDSINRIPLKIRLEKASSLDDDFLLNAKNAHKINYILGEAESYTNLSSVYYYQGKYDRELVYSLKAIALYERIGAIEKLAFEYGEMGYKMKKRDMKKALMYMQKGKSIAEKNNFEKPLLSIYNNYGVLKEMQNELDSALYFYKKGLILKEKIKDSIGIPYSLNNIACVYAMKNRFSEAEKLYEKALIIRLELKDQIGVAENYTYFGDLYFTQKNYKKAIEFYEKALQKALEFKYIDLIQNSYKMLSENYFLLNKPYEALDNYKKHSQYKDSLLNKETNSKIAELDIKFETAKKEKLILEKETENKTKNNWIILISILAGFISLIGFLIYRQQKLKNKQQEQEFELKSVISVIETQNQLQEQRLSISRDLHDNIGAQLTFVISSVDNLKYGNQISDNRVVNQLTKISDFTKGTIVELRDTIWAMNNNEFSFDDLRSRIYNFIEKAKSAKEEIVFKFNVDESLTELRFSSLIGINLYRTIQEALNNAVKYSEASEIEVSVLNQKDIIKIEIKDNGNGFDIETVDFGNGLHNMKKRIEEVGGTFEIHSQPNEGTQLNIVIAKKQ